MAKIIAHIDLNAFFVRCEEIKNPYLENKAVAIGHKGRAGIISTCSYEARKFGVRSGDPTFKALEKCPHLILLDGDYTYYSNKSKEFFAYIRRFSQLVEPASVDECYVDLTEYLKGKKKPIDTIKSIQDGLFKETKLKCSIGVSTNKFLAKMASDMKKPMGITIIRKKDIEKMIYPLPIGDFYGIGKKSAPKLEAMGIKTIGDLAAALTNDKPKMEEFFGKYYYVLVDLVAGKGSDEIVTTPSDPKSLGHSETLPYDISANENLVQYLKDLTKQSVEEIKLEGFLTDTIQITLKNREFKTTTRAVKIDNYTDDFNKIYEVAESLLLKNHTDDPLRLIGVSLQNLTSKSDAIIQLSLFDDYEALEEECRTKLLINELNRKLLKKKTKLTTLGDMYKETRNDR